MELNLNSTGRRWVKKSLMRSGLLGLAGRFRPPAVIILMYHSVMEDPRECADSIGIDSIHATAAFRTQMELLARNYNPVTVEDIRLFLAGGKSLPRKAVAVTFDDGYRDNAVVAAQVLNSLQMPASFYLSVECVDTGRLPWFCHLRYAFSNTKKQYWTDPSGRYLEIEDGTRSGSALRIATRYVTRFVGQEQNERLREVLRDLDCEPFTPNRRLMMTWEQARKLSREGHVVGSHSLTHPNIAYIQDNDLNYELTESKRRMEDMLSMPVVHFSYPAAALTGDSTVRTLAATEQAGYQTAVTTTHGVVRKEDNPLCLRRIAAPVDLDEFRWALEWASLDYSRS